MSGPNAENQLTRLALLERRQKRQAQSMRYAAGIAGGALVAIAGLAGYAFQTFTGNGPELPHHVHRHVLQTDRALAHGLSVDRGAPDLDPKGLCRVLVDLVRATQSEVFHASKFFARSDVELPNPAGLKASAEAGCATEGTGGLTISTTDLKPLMLPFMAAKGDRVELRVMAFLTGIEAVGEEVISDPLRFAHLSVQTGTEPDAVLEPNLQGRSVVVVIPVTGPRALRLVAIQLTEPGVDFVLGTSGGSEACSTRSITLSAFLTVRKPLITAKDS